MHNKKIITIVSLCVSLFLITAGYAIYSSNLKITGTGSIDSNFNIEVTNIKEESKKGKAVSVTEPTYTNSTATFNTKLQRAGDNIEYLVEITNSGTIDGKINTITITNPSNIVKVEVREIIEGTDFNITFSDKITENVFVNGVTSYSYENGYLSVNKVLSDIVISNAVVFEYSDAYLFDGTNYINTGVSLFNEENFSKNFEVTFTINERHENSGEYITLFNSMNESSGSFFQGVAFRINYYSTFYEVVSDDELNGNLDYSYIEYNLNNVSKVKICRIDNVIYISVNDGTLEKLRDYTGFDEYFDVPATFGAGFDGNLTPWRFFKGILSNMKIKYLDDDYQID